MKWLLACLLAAAVARASAPDWIPEGAAGAIPASAHAAVIANSTFVTYLGPDQTRTRIRYAIKILEDTHRNAARFVLPYDSDTDRILSARAWVIRPDGRRASRFYRSNFLDMAAGNNLYWNSSRDLVFDASHQIEAGGILACEVETEQSATVVECAFPFANPYYATDEEFVVTPPAGYRLAWHASSAAVPAPTPYGTEGGLRWEMHGSSADIASDRPAGFLANPQEVLVRAETGGQAPSWASMAALGDGVMDPRIEETPAIEAKAAGLTAGLTGRWERIRALADFVQSKIDYLSVTSDRDSLAGMRPHPAGQILANRYGDCKDKAVLLIALLRAIGEDGRILLINGDAPQKVSKDWPTLQFDHAIVGIGNDAGAPPYWPRIEGGALGRLIVFDPTDPLTPLGVLSAPDEGGWALIVDPSHGRLSRLPHAEGSFHCTTRSAEASLDPSGTLSAKVACEYRGLPAAVQYAARFPVSPAVFSQRLERLLQSAAPSIEGLHMRDQWHPKEATYGLRFDFRAPFFERALTDTLVEVNPDFLPAVSLLPPWRTRAEGVAWFATEDVRDSVRIKLPPGLRVDELPDDWAGHGKIIDCRLHYAAAKGVLLFTAHCSVKPGFYNRQQYEAIRRFIEKLGEAQRRPVLLRSAAHS